MEKPNIRVAARQAELVVMDAMAANRLDGPHHSTSVRYNAQTVSITIWTVETKKAFKITNYLKDAYEIEPEDCYVGHTDKGTFIRLVFKNDYLIDYWSTVTLDEVLDEFNDKEYDQPFELPEDDEDDNDPFAGEYDEDEEQDCNTCPFRLDCIAFVPDYSK